MAISTLSCLTVSVVPECNFEDAKMRHLTPAEPQQPAAQTLKLKFQTEVCTSWRSQNTLEHKSYTLEGLCTLEATKGKEQGTGKSHTCVSVTELKIGLHSLAAKDEEHIYVEGCEVEIGADSRSLDFHVREPSEETPLMFRSIPVNQATKTNIPANKGLLQGGDEAEEQVICTVEENEQVPIATIAPKCLAGDPAKQAIQSI